MRSKKAEFFDQMQHLANEENIVVQARHIDVLDYYLAKFYTPAEALNQYKRFLIRWNALTNNGKNTEATF